MNLTPTDNTNSQLRPTCCHPVPRRNLIPNNIDSLSRPPRRPNLRFSTAGPHSRWLPRRGVRRPRPRVFFKLSSPVRESFEHHLVVLYGAGLAVHDFPSHTVIPVAGGRLSWPRSSPGRRFGSIVLCVLRRFGRCISRFRVREIHYHPVHPGQHRGRHSGRLDPLPKGRSALGVV